MKPLKIKFVDFWGDFNPHSNFIVDALKENYELVWSDSPDYLFFSTFGYAHLRYNCVKIMFVGENIVPDFNLCDYAMGFDFLNFGDRYMRLPLFLIRDNFKELSMAKGFSPEKVLDRKFCSIVVSNSQVSNPIRERFFFPLAFRIQTSGLRRQVVE